MQEPWQILFKRAEALLKSANIRAEKWTFGGGTVLKQIFNHRESKDIDIFFRDPQLLAYVSPRTNDAVETSISNYTEMSNFTRLYFPEGEIDFIVTPSVSTVKAQPMKILDSYVYVDSPIEIIAKKIYYRAENFTPRDIFDLAIVYNAQPEQMKQNAKAFLEKLPILENRINILSNSNIIASLLNELTILEGGKKIRGKELEICQEFINEIKRNKEVKYEKHIGMPL